MIIDAKTITLTLVIVAVAAYFGLQFIRQLTLSIAQENHDANLAMDMTEEAKRAKRQRCRCSGIGGVCESGAITAS